MSRQITYVKTSSLNRKFFQLLGALLLFVVSLNIWLNINSKGELLLNENVLVLADNILLQTSHSAAFYIENDDLDSLQQLTESALESDYIHEMLIYDERGVVLSQSSNAVSTKERFLQPDSQQNKNLAPVLPIPFVKEIRNNDGQLLGFVRITVLRKYLQQQGVNFVQTINKQILLLALLAGFIGYLLTIGMRPFSANSILVKK